MQDLTTEEMRTASPESILAAQNGDIDTAIEVLKTEAEQAEGCLKENLEATVQYLENEVKN